MGKAEKRRTNIQKKKDNWVEVEINPDRAYIYNGLHLHGSYLIMMGYKTVNTKKVHVDGFFPIFGLWAIKG